MEVNALLALLRGELGDVLGVTSTVPDAVSNADDALADAAGVRVVQIDSCTKCQEHVWGEEKNLYKDVPPLWEQQVVHEANQQRSRT